jgi:hypothetical protein
MPAGDGTGPAGRGPLTGRGVGYCTGGRPADLANPGPGRNFAMGRGRGRGWRHQYYATGRPAWARYGFGGFWEAPQNPAFAPYPVRQSKEQEASSLKAQAEWLKEELGAITKQIDELERPD